jgi:hypothetical protein
MENMDKGCIEPKWVLIVENTPNASDLSAQFVFPSPKVLDFNEKRFIRRP